MKSSLPLLVFAVVTVTLTASVVKREVSIGSSSISSNGTGTSTSGFVASTGPDGKIHYVKNVNVHIEKGILDGPMPSIDLTGVLSNIPNPDKLNCAIKSSVANLLQKLNLG